MFMRAFATRAVPVPAESRLCAPHDAELPL